MLKSITCGGGPVPTALATFSRLGGKAAFISAVGDRQEGLKIRCDLAGYGVDVSMMLIRPDRTSAKAYIWVDQQNGDRTVALDSGDVEPVKVDEIPEEILATTPLLLIDGRHAPGTIITGTREDDCEHAFSPYPGDCEHAFSPYPGSALEKHIDGRS